MYAVARPRRLVRLPRAGHVSENLVAVPVAVLAAALTFFITHSHPLTGVAALVVVAGSLWLATTRHRLLGLAVIMVYLGLLDGYLKLASGSSYVTLVRDVLIYAFALGELARVAVQRQRIVAPPLSLWVIGFSLLVLAQILNPSGGTVLHSLAGVRQHLEFVPLFFLAYTYVRTVRALRIFLVLLLIIGAANGIVGYIQYNESPEQLAAWGPGYADRVLGKGLFQLAGRSFASAAGTNRTRPFGLGSDAGAGGVFGAFALAGILALGAGSRRLRYLVFAAIMAIGAVVAVVTSESRGVVVGALAIALAYGLLTATSRGRAASLLGVAAGAVVAVLVIQAIVGSSATTLRYQGLNPTQFASTLGKARGKGIAAIAPNIVDFPLGAGLATAGPASGTVSGGTQLVNTVDTESEFSFLVVETGIPGMVILTGFLVALIAVAIRGLRRVRDRETQLLLAGVAAPLVGILVLFLPSAISPTIPAGPYLWAAGGILSYWLLVKPRLDRQADGGQTADSAPAG